MSITLLIKHEQMEAIRFTQKYDQYLEEIRSVIKPELLPILDELKEIDPHDLVRPESWFQDEDSARGYVWSLFLSKALYKSGYLHP
jgi:hypothetical protein